MDADRIEKIRDPGFTAALFGYNRAQVDSFLAAVVEWIETSDAPDERSAALTEEIGRLNEQTAGVLSAAGAAAADVRRTADEEAARTREEAEREAAEARGDADTYSTSTRGEADSYAETTRTDADTYSQSTRHEADGYAAQRRQDADGESERIIADAQARADAMLVEGKEAVRDLEMEISDLKERRNALLDELEHLASSLTGTATLHRDTQAMDVVEAMEADDEIEDEGEADARSGVEEFEETSGDIFDDEQREDDETRTLPRSAPTYVEDDAAEHRVQGFDPIDEDGIGGFGATEAETDTMAIPPRRDRSRDDPDDPGR